MTRMRSVKTRLLIFCGVAGLATASFAQSGAGGGQNIPTGSPLVSGQANPNAAASSQNQNSSTAEAASPTGGFEPTSISDPPAPQTAQQGQVSSNTLLDSPLLRTKAPPAPSEFQQYVQRVIGRPIKRFGEDLLLPSNRDFAAPATATVPPDYILNVGDTVSISLTGSMDGSVDREIDTDGKIILPKVGPIYLAGTRYADVKDRVAAAIGRQYRGYEVTVGIKRLRGVRVYVTGFANNPGAFSVSSLSTIANAVFQAGGPSSGGSFRSVKLYRHGREVADFDLYDLVRGGSRINDAVLQNEDVLFIPPAGPQVAVIGSVNAEAIYEAKPGESIDQLLAYAGGANSVGDPTRVVLYRSSDPNMVGPQNLGREATRAVEVAAGDIMQILSKGTLIQPIDRQSVLVRIEGEVNRPGTYYVAPNTPMSSVLELAGGLTNRAFAYGTKLQRVSVRQQQRESFQEAVKQLELTLAAAPLTSDQSMMPGERAAQLAGARESLNRLREAEPDGRLVLDISPSSGTLPANILLENNDSIVVPPRIDTVGVFGAVYRPASFLLNGGPPPRVKDYIDRAGGTLRAADRNAVFVVRANGEVLPKRRGALNARVLPGDVIFVPVKTQSGTFWTKLQQMTTTLFQLGLSTATIGAVVK